jgi:hypothetical protein
MVVGFIFIKIIDRVVGYGWYLKFLIKIQVPATRREARIFFVLSTVVRLACGHSIEDSRTRSNSESIVMFLLTYEAKWSCKPSP